MSTKHIKITDLKCFPAKSFTTKFMGGGRVTLNEMISISFTIYKNNSGEIFVAWPSRKAEDKDGGIIYYKDVDWIDRDAYKFIENEIVDEFNKALIKPKIYSSEKPKAQEEQEPIEKQGTTNAPLKAAGNSKFQFSGKKN